MLVVAIKRLLILCITRVTDPAITLFRGDAVKSTSDYRHGIIQYLQDWVMLFEVTLDVTEGFFNGVIVWAIGRKEQEEYPCRIKNINHSLDMGIEQLSMIAIDLGFVPSKGSMFGTKLPLKKPTK